MSYQAISDVQQRNDGHIYYVIGKEGGGDFIARCKTIGERNSLTGKGICFVEQAYKDDPTVMRGWALYMSNGTETTTTFGVTLIFDLNTDLIISPVFSKLTRPSASTVSRIMSRFFSSS